MVWIGTRSGKIFLYDVDTLGYVGCFNIDGSVECLVASDFHVWTSTGNCIQIWEWKNSQLKMLKQTTAHSSFVKSISYMQFNSQVWTGGFDGTIIVWDAQVPFFILHFFCLLWLFFNLYFF